MKSSALCCAATLALAATGATTAAATASPAVQHRELNDYGFDRTRAGLLGGPWPPLSRDTLCISIRETWLLRASRRPCSPLPQAHLIRNTRELQFPQTDQRQADSAL